MLKITIFIIAMDRYEPNFNIWLKCSDIPDNVDSFCMNMTERNIDSPRRLWAKVSHKQCHSIQNTLNFHAKKTFMK